MNVLLMQAIAHRGFPFPITLDADDEIPNETTRAAIDDLDANRNLSRYASVDQMLKDVL